MRKNNITGDYRNEQIIKLCNKIISNAGFIEDNDMEVLKFLSTKGLYENKKVVVIDKHNKVLI